MPRTRIPWAPLAWLVVLMLLAFAGNWSGHLLARAGFFRGGGDHPAGSALHPAGGRDTKPARTGTSRGMGEIRKKLERLAHDSPDLDSDWEAKAAINRILADLSSAELEELYGLLDQELGGDTLARMVGAMWVAADPDAAVRAGMAQSDLFGDYYAVSMFSDWAKDHPREAFAWLDSKAGDPAFDGIRHVRAQLLDDLFGRDFTLAQEELRKLDASDARMVVSVWAYGNVADPAARERLLDFARTSGNPDVFASVNSNMMRGWPENDPMGLMNHLLEMKDYLESDAVPAASRTEVDARVVGAAIFRHYDEHALEWWMGRYSQSAETPPALQSSIQEWTRSRPQVAAQWLADQPPSPQRDALNATAAPAFMAKKLFPQAAESLGNISDPEMRRDGMVRLSILWGEHDPAAAAAWAAGVKE